MSNALVTKTEGGPYDISFDISGNLNMVKGIDEIIQDITTNILLIKGEWFISIDAGIDYFGVVFSKRSSIVSVDSEFIKAIENTTGVVNVISYSSTIDKARRDLTITFNASTTAGETGKLEVPAGLI